MPRRKRQADGAPQWLNPRKRQRLSWNLGGGVGATNSAENDDFIDDSVQTGGPTNGNVDENFDSGGSVTTSTNTRSEFEKFIPSRMQKFPFLTLNYFDGESGEPPDDCVFLLYEFTVGPKQGESKIFEDFVRLCSEENVRVFRLYYGDPKKLHYLQTPLPLPILYSPALLDAPMVSCRVEMAIGTLELFRQRSSFQLTFDGTFSTIRVWIKNAMFAANAIGEGVDQTPALNLRRLMRLLFPEECSGHVIEPGSKDGSPHKLYDKLKPFRQSIISTTSDYEQLDQRKFIPYLRPYQVDAVKWMLQRERNPQAFAEMGNPLFVSIRDSRTKEKFYYNPYGGFFLRQEPPALTPTSGGILAEEMGLGKTVEMLTLILLNPKENVDHSVAACQENVGENQSIDSGQGLEADCRLQAEEAFQQKTLDELRYQREKRDNYKRKIVFKPKAALIQDNATLQCFCGRVSKEMDPSPRLRCSQCNTWQHSSCVRWPEDAAKESYLCPSCRCSNPENAVDGKATLIVSPASISDQWYAEIKKHIRNEALSVYIYRGVQSEGFIQPHTLAQYDIVIVTYETLRIELNYVESMDSRKLRHPKRFANAPSPLGAVKWWRLCLDEAQMVESAMAKAAQMCLQLSAKFKWCVTGTPMQKSVDDLYGLFLLLDVDPYSIRLFWKDALYLPYALGINERLPNVVAPILWRTSKADVLDQLEIPEQEHCLRWIDLSAVEDHFYKRIREECFEQFDQVIRKFQAAGSPLDRGKKLNKLDRLTLDQLLRPLLKLRQACCHPQLVRGGRFINFDHMLQRMRVVTMDALLDRMIKKTRNECEDSHRGYVASLNGLAALEWMQDMWADSAEWYREVLRSCDHYEKQIVDGEPSTSAGPNSNQRQNDSTPVIRTDLLQKLHAIYNLNILVNEHRDAVPPTLRDDALGKECDILQEKYLVQSIALLEKCKTDLDTAQSTGIKNLENFRPVWYVKVLRALSEDREESRFLEERLQQQLLETKWSTRFRDVSGLIYLITTHCDALINAREKLSDGMKSLLATKPDELLVEAQQCHLRIDADGRALQPKSNCTICVMNSTFEEYEERLFAFQSANEPAATVLDALNNETVNLYGHLRRGTWADSDLEKTLKVLYALASRSIRRNLIDHDTLEAASSHMKVFEVLKQEFRASRAAWMGVRDHVARRDEVRMALERLSNLSLHEVQQKRAAFVWDRQTSQTTLRRQLPQLAYLENLKKESQPVGEEAGNPEECPVCRVELGKSWLVLTACGHSLCSDCHRLLTNNGHNNGQCPVCRRVTPRANVQEVIFKKSEEQLALEDEAKKYQIRGSYSVKIEESVRCLLEIRQKEPTAKALVFSNWQEVLAVLSSALTQNHLEHVLMNVAGEKWRRNLTKFKTSTACNVMLLPLKNGANGLNIIEATHVLMIDPTLNPGCEQQALGRVHRIGQKKKTTVHRFLVRGTVEEKIYGIFGRQVVKVDGPLMDEDESGSLTVNDLFDLFQTIAE